MLSDPDAREAWFTVGDVKKKWVPWLSSLRSSLQSRPGSRWKEFGISWTQQSGFNANQGQEINVDLGRGCCPAASAAPKVAVPPTP